MSTLCIQEPTTNYDSTTKLTESKGKRRLAFLNGFLLYQLHLIAVLQNNLTRKVSICILLKHIMRVR